MRNKVTFWAFTFLTLCSCKSRSQGDQQLLESAYLKQNEAIKIIEDLEHILEQSVHENKDSLIQVIDELEEGLFPIPGYKLDLPGHEGHDHGHAKIALSSEEIHNVQKELVEQLREIQNNLKNP